MERRFVSSKAFSLIEMIVVIGLLVLIGTAAMFRMRGFSETDRIETVRGDLRVLQSAVRTYFLHHRGGDGNSIYPSGDDWQVVDLAQDEPRVLRQVLYDPFAAAGTEYRYSVSPDGKYYVFFSVGPNGTANITGINNAGKLVGRSVDDVFVTNGTGTFGAVIGPASKISDEIEIKSL